ncbi:AgmX/PglI C-terminal domain-containing protein, partial [Myxococcota bacterium]|nr:AgmX/PglI C-terminal domain-containing protein [Myxococcota bacterium]
GASHKRGARVRAGSATVYGEIDPAKVRAVIRAHRKEVDYCYKQALFRHKKLSGTVTVSFLISATSNVKSCEVKQDLSKGRVGKCICAKLSKWRFPKPKNTVRVIYKWSMWSAK